eukprot:564463-Karenia_brevis.AAC.1
MENAPGKAYDSNTKVMPRLRRFGTSQHHFPKEFILSLVQKLEQLSRPYPSPGGEQSRRLDSLDILPKLVMNVHLAVQKEVLQCIKLLSGLLQP